MIKKISGTFEREEQAVQAIKELKEAGYDGEQISVVAKNAKDSEALRNETGTKAPEGMTAGALTGGTLGGAAGVLASLGALAIPGIGPLLAAGPIAAALAGAAVGAGVGGLAGGLIGLGIPEKEAEYYDERIHRGDVLVMVEEDESMRSRIYEVFRRSGANNTSYFDPDGTPSTSNMAPVDERVPPAGVRGAELPASAENAGDPARSRDAEVDLRDTTDPTRQSANLITGKDGGSYPDRP
ncbi:MULTISPECIES: general stress protein [Saccharibacillus]|uniref:general stress protein n=1 Tax=Saccharibacillus TaxID=456492 RepID=UPI001924D890|nr:general stress protein [Saccharibacillus sp. WB 17]